jgi:hypothetical protein
METIMDKLIDLSGRNDEEIRDIAGLGEFTCHHIYVWGRTALQH